MPKTNVIITNGKQEEVKAEPTPVVVPEAVKKPRAFVGGDDIFDFSGLKTATESTSLNVSKPAIPAQ